MTDVTPNIPEVVAEVRALFERYEQALVDRDVAVLDATFWNSPHTIRYALPGIKEKRIRLEILTLGRDLATVAARARPGCASPTSAGRWSARTCRR